MDWILSAMVGSAIALTLGAVALFRRGGAAKQAWLMLAAALVVAGNVLILTV